MIRSTEPRSVRMKEYLLITEAHKKASDEMAGLSEDSAVFDWDTRLRDSPKEAARAEMWRGNTLDKSIQ
jgi:hypothetical protein